MSVTLAQNGPVCRANRFITGLNDHETEESPHVRGARSKGKAELERVYGFLDALADPVREALAREFLVGLDVAGAGGLHDGARQSRRGRALRLVPTGLRAGQPVAHVLLVEAGLDLALLVALGGPVAGRIRGQNLVRQHQGAIGIQTELELGIG